jgi:AmmeMemoRadiSam system protein B/AmmeMemoRadiSam system protein A
LFGLLFLLIAGCRAGEVRPPAVAGSFYEKSPFALDRQVESLLKQAVRPAVTGSLIAAVSPHAGYVYSGRCAANVYSLISSGQFDRVIILCPSHHVMVNGVSLPDPALTAYATPLGNVEIDRAVCDILRGQKGFVTVPAAAAREHAIEVQLPFLQKTVRNFQVIPLICGADVDVESVSRALVPYVGSRTLLLASTDFTHYGPNYGYEPFTDKVPERLGQWLALAGGRIAALDVKGFDAHCAATRDTICGEMPIRIMMATLRRSDLRGLSGLVLDTATSGGLTGNYRNSVSYAAIGFFADIKKEKKVGVKEGCAVKEHRTGSWSPGLNGAEQAALFAIARDTLKWCVEGRKGTFDFGPYTLTPRMKTEMATFVTLKIRGGLRGCIGSLTPEAPLYVSVHDNAVNAALRDPRFDPVQPGELSRITVDVSILSPIRDIPSIADFKIGQQGIILEKGRCRAVYLPEVATEQGWTVEETLSSLSQKAGLPSNAWREGARFKVFESVVLSE